MSFVPLFEVVVSKKTENKGFLNDNNNNNNTPLVIENDSILQSQTIIVIMKRLEALKTWIIWNLSLSLQNPTT